MIAESWSKPNAWAAVPRHSGYEASLFGEIRSYRKPSKYGGMYSTPKIISQSRDEFGRPRMRITDDSGKRYSARICRLVIAAFSGEQPGKEVRHMNGINTDNRPSNLRWGTHLENMRDKIDHGTNTGPRGAKNPNVKLKKEHIPVIRKRLESGESLRSVAKDYGVGHSTICNIKHSATWGYVELSEAKRGGRRG